MITVACVLKLGGAYDRSWVRALKRGLNEHLTDFEFVCLTDDMSVEPYWRIPLKHGWKGWWSKIECFRPGIFERGTRVLYIDLDSLPVGDLSDLAGYRGRFAMLNDFLQGRRLAASGVMAWEAGEADAIYERFVREGARTRPGRSDPFYSRAMPQIERLQEHYPDQLCSFKKHARNGIPDGSRLVCFHGQPRPNDPRAGWGYDLWRSRAS